MKQESSSFRERRCQPEIVPRIGKPGYYLYGRECWFENYAGRAYRDNPKLFNYNLRVLRASELNTKQWQALKTLVEERLATRTQKQLFADYLFAMQQKEYMRNVRKTIKFYIFDDDIPF